jgi:hypothetical protein
VRLLDATPVPCGQSAVTARRSGLFGWAGYGYCPSHSRWYWGAKLMLMCTCEGMVTGFGLANPKLYGERDQARQMLNDRPANRPAPGTAIVTGKGLAGEDTEEFFASPGLGLDLIRPVRKDENPRYFPNWLRQRVEAIIWTLKNQLGIERHGGRVPAGLWARIVQRLLALNAVICVVRGTTATVSPSMSSWTLWSSAVTVTVLRAWIMPTWIRWVATMIWPRWDTRRCTVTGAGEWTRNVSGPPCPAQTVPLAWRDRAWQRAQ